MGWLLNIKFITGFHSKFCFKLEKLVIPYNITIPIYCGNNAVSLIKLSMQASFTEQQIKFSIKDFFSKCDQIRSFLQIWSCLLKEALIENFIFCAVHYQLNLFCP